MFLAVAKVCILWFSTNILAIIFSFLILSLGDNHFDFIKQEAASGLNFCEGGITSLSNIMGYKKGEYPQLKQFLFVKEDELKFEKKNKK